MKNNRFYCDCNMVHDKVVTEVKNKMLSEIEFKNVSNIYKIFADDTRIKILWALNEHEMCVCDIANLLSMTKSAISHQLFTLRKTNLVKYRKEGKTVFYSLCDNHVKNILEIAIEHIKE